MNRLTKQAQSRSIARVVSRRITENTNTFPARRRCYFIWTPTGNGRGERKTVSIQIMLKPCMDVPVVIVASTA